MKKTLSWAALAGLCLAACGGNSNDHDAEPTGQAGDGGAPASAGNGGSKAGTAGHTAQAGEAGSDDSGALPAGAGGQAGNNEAGAGGDDEAGAGGNSEAGAGGREDVGAAGAGGEAPCNELELIPELAPCTAFTAAPAATGGDIVDGVYQLIAWEAVYCLADLQQTVSIKQTAPDTFESETVATLGGLTRANGVFVTNGTTLTDTQTCGGNDALVQVWDYSAYQEESTDFLRLSDAASFFTFERVGN